MLFYILAAVIVLLAGIAVTRVSPFSAVLFLGGALLAQAVLFVTMEAYLIAVLQVLLYIGAVMVMILFVIMLMNLGPRSLKWKALSGERIVIGSAAFYLALVLGMVIWFIYRRGIFSAETPAPSGTVESVGSLLIAKYTVPFELLSVLLLAAIVGAVVTSKRSQKE